MAMIINGSEVIGITIGLNEAIRLEIGGEIVWEKPNPDTELCLENTSDSSATFTAYKTWNTNESYIDLWYSTDDGETWTDLGLNVMSRAGDAGGDITQTVTVPANGKIYLRGDNADGIGNSAQYVKFSMDASHNVSGNILSLIDADGFSSLTPSLTKGFYYLFYGDTNLVDAGGLKIPLATVPDDGLFSTFQDCTSLTTAPDLTFITSVGARGMEYMFFRCSALTDVSDLSNITTIGNSGCCRMFEECTSLINPPSLPVVTTVPDYGFQRMFYGCTSLVAAADMSYVTTITSCGCQLMYYGCSALADAPDMSVLTTVGNYGLQGMFNRCGYLTSSPDMSHITSVGTSGCGTMFYNAYRLNTLTCPNLSSWNTDNFANWMENAGNSVVGTKTFNKPTNLSIPTGNVSGVPNGWTVVDY